MPGTTTSLEAFLHLLNGQIGSGILSMPAAFGLSNKIGWWISNRVNLHPDNRVNEYICDELELPVQDYEQVAELTVAHGPPTLRSWAKTARFITSLFIVASQLGACAVYYLFIAENLKAFDKDSLSTRKKGMPLYRTMANPKAFARPIVGVVDLVNIIIISLNFLLGLLGYLKYGDDVGASVTLSLPNEPIFQSVQLMYAFAVLMTYPITMYVPIEMLWPQINNKLVDKKMSPLTPWRFTGNKFTGQGARAWLFGRNLTITVIGLLAFVLGTYYSLMDLVTAVSIDHMEN
ncbi:unnamed protein product [Oppiella nova]|uniref:Amino acid transporter transmembrane domain-containing protein n=1 Tax=Oppiella nova TaxID=334625 RepID=A0A7R9M3N3_9ACAR|nr:unnamed protein product [Oppiella nova]CAG2170115.1 unnamed protein product [Oppiella nova]